MCHFEYCSSKQYRLFMMELLGNELRPDYFVMWEREAETPWCLVHGSTWNILLPDEPSEPWPNILQARPVTSLRNKESGPLNPLSGTQAGESPPIPPDVAHRGRTSGSHHSAMGSALVPLRGLSGPLPAPACSWRTTRANPLISNVLRHATMNSLRYSSSLPQICAMFSLPLKTRGFCSVSRHHPAGE